MAAKYYSVLIGLGVVITVTIVIVLLASKKRSASPAATVQAPFLQRREPAAKQSMVIQSGYQGSGYLPPNTYSYTVMQPKYKAGMGSVFDSLQPIHSVSAEFAGHFAPPETTNSRC